MSGVLKTVSNLEQSFFACLPAIAGREAFAVLEKPGGSFRQGGFGQKAQMPGTRGVGQAFNYPLGGGEGHSFLFSQSAYFLLQDSLGQTCPAGLGAESQPARHKQGR